ncbi:hypothetical protein KFU94_69430 [Chloroflexi bacterium TSY]|nr:hypothetical protein [Chloroflexi bacterium TSY]
MNLNRQKWEHLDYSHRRHFLTKQAFTFIQVFALLLSLLRPVVPVAAATRQASVEQEPALTPGDLGTDGKDRLLRVDPNYLYSRAHEMETSWHGEAEDAPLVVNFGDDAPLIDPAMGEEVPATQEIAGLDQWLAGNNDQSHVAGIRAAVLGPKKVLVLRVYFNDYSATSTFNANEVAGLFDNVNTLWKNTSYGKMSIDYVISGLFKLPGDRRDYVDDRPDGDRSRGAKADRLMTDAVNNVPFSVNWAQIDALVVVMAETDSSQFHRGFGGQCTMGSKTMGCVGVSENPGENANVRWGRIAHEIGHAFQQGDPGHPSNYNNDFELMDRNYPGQIGVFEKYIDGGFPGWMPKSKYVEVDPNTGGETICLWAMEYDPTDKPNPQAIKANITGGLYYMVSVRRRVLGDELNGYFTPPGIPDEGVLIERVSEGSVRWVTVQGKPNIKGIADIEELWKVGDTFTNSSDGITIEVVDQQGEDDYCVRIIYGNNANQPDVMLDPWRSPPGNTWETTDIWFDSPVNGYDTYRYGMWNDLSGNLVPSGNGDDPAVGLVNRVYARVRNVGRSTATNVKVNFEITDPLGVGIAGSNGWVSLGSTDKTSFPGLASIAPGAFVDVYIEWIPPNITVTPEQIADGRFAFHSCVRVKLDPVAGETVLGNQDGDREQENISYFQAAEEPGGGTPVYENVVTLRNDDLTKSKYFFLNYDSDLPAAWNLDINGGDLGVELGPNEVREIPVIIEPNGLATVGSVFGVDIKASSMRELVNDRDPTDTHLEFKLLGGVRIETRVLIRPTVECQVTADGEIVVDGTMTGHEEYYDEKMPFNVLIQGVDINRQFIHHASSAVPVNNDGIFQGAIFSQQPEISEVICMFAGTTELASATSGYVTAVNLLKPIGGDSSIFLPLMSK